MTPTDRVTAGSWKTCFSPVTPKSAEGHRSTGRHPSRRLPAAVDAQATEAQQTVHDFSPAVSGAIVSRNLRDDGHFHPTFRGKSRPAPSRY